MGEGSCEPLPQRDSHFETMNRPNPNMLHFCKDEHVCRTNNNNNNNSSVHRYSYSKRDVAASIAPARRRPRPRSAGGAFHIAALTLGAALVGAVTAAGSANNPPPPPPPPGATTMANGNHRQDRWTSWNAPPPPGPPPGPNVPSSDTSGAAGTGHGGDGSWARGRTDDVSEGEVRESFAPVGRGAGSGGGGTHAGGVGTGMGQGIMGDQQHQQRRAVETGQGEAGGEGVGGRGEIGESGGPGFGYIIDQQQYQQEGGRGMMPQAHDDPPHQHHYLQHERYPSQAPAQTQGHAQAQGPPSWLSRPVAPPPPQSQGSTSPDRPNFDEETGNGDHHHQARPYAPPPNSAMFGHGMVGGAGEEKFGVPAAANAGAVTPEVSRECGPVPVVV